MVTLAHILLRWRTKIDADIPTAVALHAPGTSIHKLLFTSSRCCHHRYESSVAVAALERTLTIFTNPRKICRLLFLPLLLFTYLVQLVTRSANRLCMYKIISNSIREKNKVLRKCAVAQQSSRPAPRGSSFPPLFPFCSVGPSPRSTYYSSSSPYVTRENNNLI